MKKIILMIGLWFLTTTFPASAAEPTMADYHAMPIIAAQAVTPNIMIILDNSGSMNEPAYPDSFAGAPYSYGEYPVVGYDDIMESSGGTKTAYSGLEDIDLGEKGNVAGIRFQNIQIDQGTELSRAYIEFVARYSDSIPTDLTIVGEDADNSDPFSSSNPITKRATTDNSVAWNNIKAWTSGVQYNSPDLTAIVQEIINREGWSKGNAISFKISGTGERDVVTRNESETLMPVLRIETKAVKGTTYYGYFNPDYFYEYNSNIFIPAYKKVSCDGSSWTVYAFNSTGGTDGNGELSQTATTLSSASIEGGYWDGNFLNWATMRRVDVLRKVLVGGYSTTRGNGGKQSIIAEDPDDSANAAGWNNAGYAKTLNTTNGMPVCPYHGKYTFYMDKDGNLQIQGESASYHIEVQKEVVIESSDFDDSGGEVVGVVQRIGSGARWGNTWFNSGSTGQSGGRVENAIDSTTDDTMATMVESLSTMHCTTRTPLAETMYVVMQYFKQEDLQSGLGYPNNCLPSPVAQSGENDPYYNNELGVLVPCAQSFVILLTDGGSTADSMVPDFLQDADNDGNDGGGGGGGDSSSDYLDDVAFYAHTNDLRDDMEDDQNITLYTIYTFGDDNTARQLLMDAAQNGGFDDHNGNNKPDQDLEWDEDGDGLPDTFFEASDGYVLEAKLLAAMSDIMKRATSGTASSVLSTSNEGSGNSIQAYFKAVVEEDAEEAKWLGYMKNLWVDSCGNLREDSNGNLKLDQFNSSATNTADGNVDKIIQFYTTDDETRVERYTTHYLYNPDHGTSDTCDDTIEDCSVASEDLSMDEISPIFDSSARLAAKDPATRKIYTYIDRNEDNIVDTGEWLEFTTANASTLTPYLGVGDDASYGNDGGLGLGDTQAERVENVISWIRGTDIDGLRNRTLSGTTWRLGDIVNSTPMMVGLPQEYYHELYEDLDYVDYIKYATERETMIYVGANDGMLHAFTSWNSMEDDDGNIWYEKPSTAAADEEIGDEIWAYIPQSLLPHLKWTAHSDYSHTYYVDAPVRVFDAKILPKGTYYHPFYSVGASDADYGTFMVFGLNMGGKQITVNEDFGTGTAEERTFYPTYVMMDVTEPRNPKLMWERTYPELGMTTCIPSPLHIGARDGSGNWYLVFGSGPTSYEYTTTINGHIFVVDMTTGDPVEVNGNQWIATSDSPSYFNEALVLDLFQTHNADAVYIANNFLNGETWQSDIWKIAIPCSKCLWDVDGTGNQLYDVDEVEYSTNPGEWKVAKAFFKADGPITAQMNSTVDPDDNVLLYVGTGRYLAEDDKEDNSQQYLYCIKDPFYFQKGSTDYHDFGKIETTSLDKSALMNADDITVVVNSAGDYVLNYTAGTTEFWDFVEAVREGENGWYLSMQMATTTPSERIITQTAILGGIQMTPAYTPVYDICGMGGATSFIGTYYETGTGYSHQLFAIDNPGSASVNGEAAEIIAIRDDDLYEGLPAPKVIFHVGSEEGATITTQSSTGEFVDISVDPALYFKNMATEWWDNPDQTPTFFEECK